MEMEMRDKPKLNYRQLENRSQNKDGNQIYINTYMNGQIQKERKIERKTIKRNTE